MIPSVWIRQEKTLLIEDPSLVLPPKPSAARMPNSFLFDTDVTRA